jgi:Transmembrane protein 43
MNRWSTIDRWSSGIFPVFTCLNLLPPESQPMDDDNSYEYEYDSSDNNTDGDYYSETTSTNWFQEIGNSLFGMLIGLVLFLASFVVLFLNEGRLDFSQAAKSAIVIQADAPAPQAHGKTVALTGAIASPEILGDGQYLKPAPYIALGRTVEMYSWREAESSQSTKQVGGGKTTTKTYRYTKVWTNKPESSAKFKQATTHRNPAKSIADQIYKVKDAKIGRYGVDLPNLPAAVPMGTCNLDAAGNSERASAAALRLQPDQLLPVAAGIAKPQLVGDQALFLGRGTLGTPQVGDLRICYTVLPNQAQVTLFGKLAADRVVPARFGKEPFFKIFPGERQAAIGALKTEYNIQLWAIRVLGFILMWVGLMLVMGVFSAIANVLPFLGDLVEAVSGFAAFIAAGLLSTVTILVSSLLHNPIALAASAVIALGVFLLGRKGVLQFQR